MPITQDMIDICQTYRDSDVEQRIAMRPIIHDVFCEGGFPKIANRHFRTRNKTMDSSYRDCVEGIGCVMTEWVLNELIEDLNNIEGAYNEDKNS